jgi:acetyl esterase/lipase
VLQNAPCIQGDGSRVALAGEGAGGNLALATAIAARDKGLPLPRHLLAISPVAQTGTNTHSYLENAVASPFGRNAMVWCFERLVTRREQLKDRRLQLVDAELAGLPPVTLLTARIDPLRSDAQKLREALASAHVPVEWRDFEGVTNGFFNAIEVVERAREAHAYVGERLALALAEPEPEQAHSGALGHLTRMFRQVLPDLRAVSPALTNQQ